MSILTQKQNENYCTALKNELDLLLERILNPLVYKPGLHNYLDIFQTLDGGLRSFSLRMLKEQIEKKDAEYRNSDTRKRDYHIKQNRARTLITLFGEFTYSRTEYTDKHTGKPFCYIDTYLGLRKKERFDPFVQELIIQGYCDNNSMIKVGKEVGDRISGAFNSAKGRDTAISRQTVYNILHRFASITTPIVPSLTTPKILYVMLDEKFIPLQGSPNKTKAMVKIAMIFESIEAVKKKDGTPTKRKKLINKTLVLSYKGNIWDELYNILSQKYDMDKVETIYLMGDGAKWLYQGSNHIKPTNGKVIYAIDRFHYLQAIHKVTSDNGLRDILSEYAYSGSKKDFMKVLQHLQVSNQDRDTIQQQIIYLKQHWNHFQTMNKRVKIGCPMEQVVAHVVASQFTSVAKAYGNKNLPTYLNYRELHQNKHDVRNLILEAMALQHHNEKDIVIPAAQYDFSVFEKKSYPTSPTIKEFNKYTSTKF